MRYDEPLAWGGAPSEEELHTEYLDWIWRHALPEERTAIQREHITGARRRGDSHCPTCGGRPHRSCHVCAGSGYCEPALRPTTSTEDRVAARVQPPVAIPDGLYLTRH